MTLDEKLKINVKAFALWDAGKEDEAMALFKTKPMEPWMAKIWKEKIGLDALLESGWNLDEVEAAYGKEWLVT
ncbi:MAG: hypothetical protein LBS82_04580 [Spirochaetaceae bacterium]|jgi:hypothetical protein|nr:hypothetical protein [Spirochaetaceae bacterium]